MDWKTLNTVPLAKAPSNQTSNDVYNKYFRKVPVLTKEFGPIHHLSFSNCERDKLAISSSQKVKIHDAHTHETVGTISRFKQTVYGAKFSPDSHLIASGCEDGHIRLFNAESLNMLRVFKGHEGATRNVDFLIGKAIASFSDDKTVRVWDISTEQLIWKSPDSLFSDYVRAGAASTISGNIVFAGSYDHSIAMLDTRSNEECKRMNHGAPVESIACCPSSNIIVSAGGVSVKVWDTRLKSKPLIESMSEHHKTVTCLTFTSNHKYLISGSLDKKLKFYDTDFYDNKYSYTYPNDILSCSVSSDDSILAVGMSNGVISITNPSQLNESQSLANRFSESENHDLFRQKKHPKPKAVDIKIPSKKPRSSIPCDKYLRKFQFKKALELVMLNDFSRKHPDITIGLLEELMRRQVFDNVIESSSEKTIERVLEFFVTFYDQCMYQRRLFVVVKKFILAVSKKLDQLPTETVRLLSKLKKLSQRNSAKIKQLNNFDVLLSVISQNLNKN